MPGDLLEEAFLASPGDFYNQCTTLVQRATDDLVSHRFILGERLSSDEAFVDGGETVSDLTVDGNLRPGSDPN